MDAIIVKQVCWIEENTSYYCRQSARFWKRGQVCERARMFRASI